MGKSLHLKWDISLKRSTIFQLLDQRFKGEDYVRGKLFDVLEELNEAEDMAAMKLKDAEVVLSSLLGQLSSLPDEVKNSAALMNQEQQRYFQNK